MSEETVPLGWFVDAYGVMWVAPATTVPFSFSGPSGPTTWTVTGCTRPRFQMLSLEYDDEPDGFPWPYRTDGRMNHWYWKAVARVELDK